MRSRRYVRRSKSKTRRKSRSRKLPKRSRSLRQRSRSLNRKILSEYERLLFQPISSSPPAMLPSRESKHELVKRATYGGYSYNSSRRATKPQLQRFLQEEQVPSRIQDPFQKVCGPSHSSITYPVVYTKDELIRHALQKGHALDAISHFSVPKLCDLLNLSGKPIFIKPLAELSKPSESKKISCTHLKKSHLVRLAVKHGYSRAAAKRASRKDLCDILGLEDTNAVISKSVTLLASRTAEGVTSDSSVPSYTEKLLYEIDDPSSCELFSSKGEAYCNDIKLRSTQQPACEFDKATQVCRIKKLLPPEEPANKETLQKVNDTLEAKLVVEEKKLEEAKEEKQNLEDLKEAVPPYQQAEIQKKIDEAEKVIDVQEAKVEKTEDNLKLVAEAAKEQGVSLDTTITPLPTAPSVLLLSPEEVQQFESRAPTNAVFLAYRKNEARYKELQLLKQDLYEQQRKNERDIEADKVSIYPEDDPARQQRLRNRGLLLDKITNIEKEELSILSEMASQLETLRKEMLTLPVTAVPAPAPTRSQTTAATSVQNATKPVAKNVQDAKKKTGWFSGLSQKFKSAVQQFRSPTKPSVSTSKSLGLYVPNAIHTRVRIRRSRL